MSFGLDEKVNKFKSSAFPIKAVKQVMNNNGTIHEKYLEGILRARACGHDSLQIHAEEKTVVMGTMSWEDSVPITGITKQVLENAGYSVKVVEFSEWGIAYAALSKGDVQVLASQTDYAAADYLKKNKNKIEKLSPVSALKSAVDRKEWVAVTAWDPSWMTKKFDLKFLKDPKGVFPPLQGYYWIGHEGFAEANPRARSVWKIFGKSAPAAMDAVVQQGLSKTQITAQGSP
jgi:ABC-type proline/glycine betaine transport system substrate-binding protein